MSLLTNQSLKGGRRRRRRWRKRGREGKMSKMTGHPEVTFVCVYIKLCTQACLTIPSSPVCFYGEAVL
ncbi:unnamed protein product [Boreogadus saida]